MDSMTKCPYCKGIGTAEKLIAVRYEDAPLYVAMPCVCCRATGKVEPSNQYDVAVLALRNELALERELISEAAAFEIGDLRY